VEVEMFRKAERKRTNELRSAFIANREKVRSWLSGWDCPEVSWPPFKDVPQPWAVSPADQRGWVQRDAPSITDYWWLIEGASASRHVTHAHGHWKFGQRHEFESLDIEIRCTVLDPHYVAEKLALAAQAADLKGWQEGDLQSVYEWLFAGADTSPPHVAVRGQNRTGFIVFTFNRWPQVFDGPGIIAQLNMTLTDTALDGSPLNDIGRST
jgi:hypothetical protein